MQETYNDISSYQDNNIIDSNCVDITFINQGTSVVTLNNGVVLLPAVSLALVANKDEIDKTKYSFKFNSAPGLVNNLVIVRRKYIEKTPGANELKKKFYNDFAKYQDSRKISSDCGNVLFFSFSFNPLIINNIISLTSNQFYTFQINNGEVDRTIYSVYYNGTNIGEYYIVIQKKYF